jgi:hypothetical protein
MSWISNTARYVRETTKENMETVTTQPWLYLKLSPMVEELLQKVSTEIYNYNATIEKTQFQYWNLRSTTPLPKTYPITIGLILKNKISTNEYFFEVWCDGITKSFTKTTDRTDLQNAIIDAFESYVEVMDERK